MPTLSITQFKTYFWTTFVHKCKSFEQKQVFAKIVQKWAICTKQSKKKSYVANIFFIKPKLLRMWDFHIDFHFRAKKWLPWDFQMPLAHLWHSACLARGRMDQESQRMTFWDPFRSHHVCLSVVLVYQDFCIFLAQPKDQAYARLFLTELKKLSLPSEKLRSIFLIKFFS